MVRLRWLALIALLLVLCATLHLCSGCELLRGFVSSEEAGAFARGVVDEAPMNPFNWMGWIGALGAGVVAAGGVYLRKRFKRKAEERERKSTKGEEGKEE